MMKPGESMSWARLCLIQAQWFTTILDIGLLILIGFIITVISGSPTLYWRTGVTTPALTIIEHAWLILLVLIYLVATFSVMFLPPDVRAAKSSFYHGFVVGYGVPFGLHLIGEASSWFQAPQSPSLAGLSVLCAFLGGMVLCSSFIYWMMLAQPTFRDVVNNRSWVGPSRHVADAAMVTLLATLTLTCSACMLWIVTAVQPQQAFTLIINTVAYLAALIYLYCVKVNYFTSFMALGALAGVFSAIAIMAAKWTFNFASRWFTADRPLTSDLFIVALAFQAALSLYVIPFLFIWKKKEDHIESLKENPALARGAGGEAGPAYPEAS